MFNRLLDGLRSDTSADVDDGSSQESDGIKFDRIDEYPYDHYTDASDGAEALRNDGDIDGCEELMLWCVEFSEAEVRSPNQPYARPAPGYYGGLAYEYGQQERYDDQVAVLQRYIDICEEVDVEPKDGFRSRLDRACELAEQAD